MLNFVAFYYKNSFIFMGVHFYRQVVTASETRLVLLSVLRNVIVEFELHTNLRVASLAASESVLKRKARTSALLRCKVATTCTSAETVVQSHAMVCQIATAVIAVKSTDVWPIMIVQRHC
eukprot:SAG31_NODE_89_length_26711_cov_24.949459_5_plen_120_part_00